MKQNYIDGKGVYHNELNLTLAQIYDSGVEFGCKVTAKDKAEDIINELEKIKEEILEHNRRYLSDDNAGLERAIWEFIEPHIDELKGKTNNG